MDTYEEVKQLAKSLGYKGEIPDAFKGICGPSTEFIWKQLITKVKPKEEVRKIKNKIMIAKLKKQTVEDSNKVSSIKELEVWKEKRKLQEQIKELKEIIKEKENTAKRFTEEHKIRTMKIYDIKKSIKENEAKTYLLKNKSEAFQNEIAEAEKSLTFFRNLTRTESSQEEPDIGDTLRRCVEKIETSIRQQKLVAPSCSRLVVSSSRLAPSSLLPVPSCSPGPSRSLLVPPCFPGTSCSFTAPQSLLVTPQKVSVTNIFVQSDLSIDEFHKSAENKKDIINEMKCLNDRDILEDVKSLLYSKDVRSILNTILNDMEKLKTKLYKTIMATHAVSESIEQIESEERIQMTQMENELCAIKYGKEIEKLQSLIKTKENEINAVFKQLNLVNSDRKELFLLQRKEARVDGLCEFVDEKIAAFKSEIGTSNELNVINSNILKTQDKLVDDLRNVNHKYELYRKMFKTMLAYHEDTKISMMKLDQFTVDLRWMLPLTYDLHSKELLLFKEFSLEYNRRIVVGDTNLYTRDVISNISVDIETIDAETVRFLLALIDCPHDAPEILFYKLWERKNKLQTQRSLLSTIKSFNYKKYTKEELEEKESHIDTALEKLHVLLKTNSGKLMVRNSKSMTEIAKLWLELSFTDYVSQDRLYDGKNITYYQNTYNHFYNQIRK